MTENGNGRRDGNNRAGMGHIPVEASELCSCTDEVQRAGYYSWYLRVHDFLLFSSRVLVQL